MGAALESLRALADEALVERVRHCVSNERVATAELIATLGEFDVRRLYLGEGYGSLFNYCIHSLHLSERAAGSRIAAARLARRFPIVLELIADSRVSLTAVSLLARHLNEANHRLLLEEATHKTAGQVQIMVARLAPKPDAPALVRRVPASVEIELTPPAPLALAMDIDSPNAATSVSRTELEPAPAQAVRRPPAQLVKPLAAGGTSTTAGEAGQAGSAVDTRGRAARRVVARQGVLRICRTTRAMPRTDAARVASCQAIRGRRRANGGQHSAAVPRAQRL